MSATCATASEVALLQSTRVVQQSMAALATGHRVTGQRHCSRTRELCSSQKHHNQEELVTECRSRGIPPDGTVKQLRARLRALRYQTAHDSLVEIIFGKDQSIARETALPKDALAPREEQDSAQVFSASAAAEHANYQ